jgi:hypothetical protein
MMTIVTLMCHVIVGITSPVCHEEVVDRVEISMNVCQMGSQQYIADWKEKSIFRGDQWTVAAIQCIPGNDYQPRDAI